MKVMASVINLPLIEKELRQSLRGHAALVLENLCLIAFIGIALVVTLMYDPSGSPSWQAGAGAFWMLVTVQAVLAVVFGAAMAAPSLTVEGEQKTYDILASTPLVSRQIVWGKLLAGFLGGSTLLFVSAPIAAGVFLLGGVSLGGAVCSYVILFGALALGVALGLHCSVAVRRTAAAVPLAVAGALGILFVFLSFSQSSEALAAFSPLASVKQLSSGYPVGLFNLGAPVWLVSLVLWVVAALTLAEAAVEGLTHPVLRRLWGVRWRFALLVFVMALATVGSLKLTGDRQAMCAGPECVSDSGDRIERQAARLGGYATGCGVVLPFLLVPLFAAGLPSPLDRRRQKGESLAGYGLWERLFGFSLPAGLRYVVLLALLALAAGEFGLMQWGPKIFVRWWDNMVLAFLPIFAALWALGELAALLGRLTWPNSDIGRKLFVFCIAAGLLMVSWVPAVGLAAGYDEPPAAAELSSTLVLPLGIASAFPSGEMQWASPLMNSISQSVPVPFITAGWYVLAALALLLLRQAVGRRHRAKAERQQEP